MTIFSANSASFGDVVVTGSVIISGSLNLTSSQQFNSTGSLFGTASWAESSSVAISSSFAQTTAVSLQTVATASYFTGSADFPSGITSSLFGTASWAENVLPSGLPIGTVSSSVQVSYTGLSNIPSGIISSSTQFNALANTSASYAFTSSISNNFSPNTVKLTVGTTAPTSPAVNDLWVDTN